MKQFETPIAFLVFNRPETTTRVFDEIRRVKPLKLLVIADGPRSNHPGEAESCTRVRSIVEQVDWPCEVLKNYSEINLGCKHRVSSGLDWVFTQVEEAIILEDDCLPNPSFFLFCEKMLSYYRDDERVMHIGGTNFQNGKIRGDGSYYFSRVNHVWGWATWRRAWRHYDVTMATFPLFCERNLMASIFTSRRMRTSRLRDFTKAYQNKIDTWDHQWVFAIYSQNGLSIIPNVNLVTNIGFGKDATHTSDLYSMHANMPMRSLGEVLHPTFVITDSIADEYSFFTSRKITLKKIYRKLFSVFG